MISTHNNCRALETQWHRYIKVQQAKKHISRQTIWQVVKQDQFILSIFWRHVSTPRDVQNEQENYLCTQPFDFFPQVLCIPTLWQLTGWAQWQYRSEEWRPKPQWFLFRLHLGCQAFSAAMSFLTHSLNQWALSDAEYTSAPNREQQPTRQTFIHKKQQSIMTHLLYNHLFQLKEWHNRQSGHVPVSLTSWWPAVHLTFSSKLVDAVQFSTLCA